MRDIYQAENSIDAYVVKGLLQQFGIHAEVQGGDLQSGAGELPAFGLVRIAVDELDVQRAKEILKAYEAGELEIGDRDGTDV